MNLLFHSIRLYIFGVYCDLCMNICSKAAERQLAKDRSLTKKLLIFMSNLSDKNIRRWQKLEQRFIHLLIEKGQSL